MGFSEFITIEVSIMRIGPDPVSRLYESLIGQKL